MAGSTSQGVTQVAGQDVLMFHGLMLAASARGALERKSLGAFEAYFNTIPLFAGKDFDQLMAKARALQSRFASAQASAQALTELKDPTARLRMFTMAADLALSNGGLDPATDAMMEAIVKALAIPEAAAAQVLAGLMVKYQR